MGQLNAQQRAALAVIVGAVEDAVKAAGKHGAPGGVIYAGLMTQGCTLHQYETLMAGMVKAGRLRKDGELYFMGDRQAVTAL